MADRGRGTFPSSSAYLTEKWQARDHETHLERIARAGPQTNTDAPLAWHLRHLRSTSPKGKWLQETRDMEVTKENMRLVNRIEEIFSADLSSATSPQGGLLCETQPFRSGFLIRPGYKLGPGQVPVLDHRNPHMPGTLRGRRQRVGAEDTSMSNLALYKRVMTSQQLAASTQRADGLSSSPSGNSKHLFPPGLYGSPSVSSAHSMTPMASRSGRRAKSSRALHRSWSPESWLQADPSSTLLAGDFSSAANVGMEHSSLSLAYWTPVPTQARPISSLQAYTSDAPPSRGLTPKAEASLPVLPGARHHEGGIPNRSHEAPAALAPGSGLSAYRSALPATQEQFRLISTAPVLPAGLAPSQSPSCQKPDTQQLAATSTGNEDGQDAPAQALAQHTQTLRPLAALAAARGIQLLPLDLQHLQPPQHELSANSSTMRLFTAPELRSRSSLMSPTGPQGRRPGRAVQDALSARAAGAASPNRTVPSRMSPPRTSPARPQAAHGLREEDSTGPKPRPRRAEHTTARATTVHGTKPSREASKQHAPTPGFHLDGVKPKNGRSPDSSAASSIPTDPSEAMQSSEVTPQASHAEASSASLGSAQMAQPTIAEEASHCSSTRGEVPLPEQPVLEPEPEVPQPIPLAAEEPTQVAVQEAEPPLPTEPEPDDGVGVAAEQADTHAYTADPGDQVEVAPQATAAADAPVYETSVEQAVEAEPEQAVCEPTTSAPEPVQEPPVVPAAAEPVAALEHQSSRERSSRQQYASPFRTSGPTSTELPTGLDTHAEQRPSPRLQKRDSANARMAAAVSVEAPAGPRRERRRSQIMVVKEEEQMFEPVLDVGLRHKSFSEAMHRSMATEQVPSRFGVLNEMDTLLAQQEKLRERKKERTKSRLQSHASSYGGSVDQSFTSRLGSYAGSQVAGGADVPRLVLVHGQHQASAHDIEALNPEASRHLLEAAHTDALMGGPLAAISPTSVVPAPLQVGQRRERNKSRMQMTTSYVPDDMVIQEQEEEEAAAEQQEQQQQQGDEPAAIDPVQGASAAQEHSPDPAVEAEVQGQVDEQHELVPADAIAQDEADHPEEPAGSSMLAAAAAAAAADGGDAGLVVDVPEVPTSEAAPPQQELESVEQDGLPGEQPDVQPDDGTAAQLPLEQPVDEAAPPVDEAAPPVDEAAPPVDEAAPPALDTEQPLDSAPTEAQADGAYEEAEEQEQQLAGDEAQQEVALDSSQHDAVRVVEGGQPHSGSLHQEVSLDAGLASDKPPLQAPGGAAPGAGEQEMSRPGTGEGGATRTEAVTHMKSQALTGFEDMLDEEELAELEGARASVQREGHKEAPAPRSPKQADEYGSDVDSQGLSGFEEELQGDFADGDY